MGNYYDDDPDFSAAVTKRVIAVTMGERAQRMSQEFDERFPDLIEHDDVVLGAAKSVIADRYKGDAHAAAADPKFMTDTAAMARRRLAAIRGEDEDLADTMPVEGGDDAFLNGGGPEVPRRLGRSQRENNRETLTPMMRELQRQQKKAGIL